MLAPTPAMQQTKLDLIFIELKCELYDVSK